MEFIQRCENSALELRISECSSEEENTLFTRANLKRAASIELSRIEITWSSDDESGTGNCISLLNSSFIDTSAVTPTGRKCFNSARKSKLPNLSVKRKLNKGIESPIAKVRTTLGPRNIPSNLANKSNHSPWSKVRKTFSTLRYQSSLSTLDISAEQKENDGTRNRLSPYKSEGTSIEWSSSSSESGSPKLSTHSGTRETQKSTAPTELELLVALVERENSAAKTVPKQKKKSRHFVQGGYAERLQKLEEANRIERNFLQHDQQLGLQSGTRMRVLQLNKAYGVHMAMMQLEQTVCDNIDTTVRIIIDADMAAHIKIGSRIETFFDSNVQPYTFTPGNDASSKEVIYVQPHKLLLL